MNHYDKIRAEYVANRNLSIDACARAMGRTPGAVKDYRIHHPEARPDNYGEKKPRSVYQPQRDDVRKVTVANPASSSTALGVMTISLPKEPWVRT